MTSEALQNLVSSRLASALGPNRARGAAAVVSARSAAVAQPGNPLAAYAIGLGEIDLNDWEAAARALRRAAAALDKRPDDAGSAEILISLGAAERQLGQARPPEPGKALRRHPGNLRRPQFG